MAIADISRTRVLARAVRALAGATLAVRPVEDADMLSDLFLLEQPIQHRRGGEAAAGSANAAGPAHITDRDRAVQGAGL